MAAAAQLYKVIVLGDSGVGKSCLIERYTSGRYNPRQKPTIGADFATKAVPGGHMLQIWDTAGQERYRSLGTGYWRGSDGCALVCDVTSRASFDSLQFWFSQYTSHVAAPTVAVLIATKTDAPEAQHEVPPAALDAWAAERGMPVHHVSAQLNDNVAAPFECIASRLLRGEECERASAGHPTPNTRFLVHNTRVDDEERGRDPQAAEFSCSLCFS
eukprot:TRINITY_DN14000_c0_g1_i1.p2 TRINITY_DN14000_c0_g1~~TRINITY_DN14000_c0_g1_i1.p2  ORF type:complete len:215 (+),score=69.87 TRINITY_DN14000_c0_g1_i1:94-738(+)